MTLLRSLLGVALVQVCFCRTYYRDRMPNGYSVPNPCQTSAIWEGAGHFNPFHHTHLKNSFGNDFRTQGSMWTQTLCNMDSDRDNKTNGEELGDPNCVWTAGSIPEGVAQSHPGICEPIGSAQCAWQNFACDCMDHCSGLVGYP